MVITKILDETHYHNYKLDQVIQLFILSYTLNVILRAFYCQEKLSH